MNIRFEDLNLAALKYFLDAVELASITQSAGKNHISRPAVSQAIVRLEEWYGKRLLKHEKRSFELTDEGRIFFHVAKNTFKNLNDSFSQVLEAKDELRIGCSASLVELAFPKMKGFISKCKTPSIKIGSTQVLLNLLEQKQINVAFLIENEKIQNYTTSIFHRGNFELRSKTGHWRELMITTEKRPEVEAFFRFSSQRKLKIENSLEVESWTLAHRLAEMTDGMCLVPDYLPKGTLQTIKLRSWDFPYRAMIVSQKEGRLSKLESDLVKKFQL